MKKIKLFFIRNYQRLLRFFILFSVISCVALSGLTASATETYNFVFSKPEITPNSCVVEIITANGWKMCLYVSAYAGLTSTGGFSTTFKAEVLNNELRIYSVKTTTENSAGNSVPIFNRGYYMASNWNTTGSLGFNGSSPVTLGLGNSGAITAIHGYNCDVSSVSNNGDFIFSYGSDPVFQNQLNAINSTIESFKGQNQQQLQQILDAIIANKSSAEKSEYSAVTDDQKTAQADLDAAEASINADTASARTETFNLFKSFSIVGDIAKGMLAVTNLFNVLTGDLVFAPALLNFALAVGAGAFLLGLSAIVLKVVHFKQ